MTTTLKNVDIASKIVFEEYSSVSQTHTKVLFASIGVAHTPAIHGKSTAEKTAIFVFFVR